jgi:hypothetical protein
MQPIGSKFLFEAVQKPIGRSRDPTRSYDILGGGKELGPWRGERKEKESKCRPEVARTGNILTDAEFKERACRVGAYAACFGILQRCSRLGVASVLGVRGTIIRRE